MCLAVENFSHRQGVGYVELLLGNTVAGNLSHRLHCSLTFSPATFPSRSFVDRDKICSQMGFGDYKLRDHIVYVCHWSCRYSIIPQPAPEVFLMRRHGELGRSSV